MNCKPGDLARIVHPREFGRFVEVLFMVERQDQGMEGMELHPSAVGSWMCKVLGSPVNQPGIGLVRTAPINDKWLRPIRDLGDDAKDEMLRPLPIERPVETVCTQEQPSAAS